MKFVKKTKFKTDRKITLVRERKKQNKEKDRMRQKVRVGERVREEK